MFFNFLFFEFVMDLLISLREIIQMKQTVLRIGCMNVIHHGHDVMAIGSVEMGMMSSIVMSRC